VIPLVRAFLCGEGLWLMTASLAGGVELPSWEVLWLMTASLAGGVELPLWEVRWLMTAS
jgi:hypothetical protein